MEDVMQVGDRAPDFELLNDSGETVRLSSFQGEKVLVVFFYPADDTPGCTTESCGFRDAYEEFRGAGAEVFGVSKDSVQSHVAFRAKYGLGFHLLSDPNNALRRAWRVPKRVFVVPGRVTYVIDKEGIVQLVFNSGREHLRHVTESLVVVRRLAAASAQS